MRAGRPGSGPPQVGDVVGDRPFELVPGARPRVPVRPPPDELAGMPEAATLEVVVLRLDHELRSERDEGEVLAGVPAAPERAALSGGGRGVLLVATPVPGVPVERRDV